MQSKAWWEVLWHILLLIPLLASWPPDQSMTASPGLQHILGTWYLNVVMGSECTMAALSVTADLCKCLLNFPFASSPFPKSISSYSFPCTFRGIVSDCFHPECACCHVKRSLKSCQVDYSLSAILKWVIIVSIWAWPFEFSFYHSIQGCYQLTSIGNYKRLLCTHLHCF